MNHHSSNQPNQLIQEKSPYLLQHAYNPVNWYPWGEEAFHKATQENKPVLLSIGYSTCHWCHVMERESFEDIITAEILNEYFVAIKVDREERPDIDRIYMDALQAMDQQGGWPLNMFLTPDKVPFAGGTYYPPEPRYGRKSFKEVLHLIREAWVSRKDEIFNAGNNLVKFLNSIEESDEIQYLPSVKSFENAFLIYKNYFDTTYFGFKTNPKYKFPPSLGLIFLLNYYNINKEKYALEMVEKTIIAMKRGGIYDQLGGGICRYSTDHFWLVPHFEKMLYDNCLFLRLLVETYSHTKNEIYKEFAYDIIRYLDRDLKLSSGGVCSAEDADSEGKEGIYYLWEYDEIKKILGEDSGTILEYWNISPEGHFDGYNILHESLNKSKSLIEIENQQSWKLNLENIKEKLLKLRSKKVRPMRDDKILTSWNCLYISAVSLAGRIFQDRDLISSAEKTYQFISNNLITPEGRLLRRWREGEAKVNAFLSDYAEYALSSIELYQSTLKHDYLINANLTMERAIHLFSSEKGIFYDTGVDSEKLIRRSIDYHDGVEPSGNSTISIVLQKLTMFGFSVNQYLNKTESIFKYLKKEIESRPLGVSNLLQSYQMYLLEKKEIVLLCKEESKISIQIREFFLNSNLSSISFVYFIPKTETVNSIIPILDGKKLIGEMTLYICSYGVCDNPISGTEQILESLRRLFVNIGI